MAGEKTNTMAKKFYRPSEIARELDIATSTLRTWAYRFANHFDGGVKGRPLTAKGKPTARRYSERDVETLRRIKRLLAQGLNYDQVAEQMLIVELPVVQEPELTRALTVLPKLAEALGVIAEQRGRLDELDARVDALEKRARPWWRFWARG